MRRLFDDRSRTATPRAGAGRRMVAALMVAAVTPPARDGDVAIREEFDAAALQGTAAAWRLFIARHPEHPLADLARRRLAAPGGGVGPQAPDR